LPHNSGETSRENAEVCELKGGPATCVMAGLDPAIHAFVPRGAREDEDARDKRGHDAQ